MLRGIVAGALGVVGGLMLIACARSANAPSAAHVTTADAGAPRVDDEEAEPTGPVEHPFAKNKEDVFAGMEAAVASRKKSIDRCVADFRQRKAAPLATLTVKLGVDQEGTLIGVAGNGGECDTIALECLRAALRRAPFPRSHAGIIEIERTFEYQAVNP